MSSGTKYYQEQIIKYNTIAIDELRMQNYEKSLGYLKQALTLLKRIQEEPLKSKLITITFNNLGNFFKKLNNFPEALKYLYKIIELEDKVPEQDSGNIAYAHLSICTILSQQKNHMQALRHGLKSIYILKSIYKFKPKLVPSLVIAYQNVGTEYKYIGDPTNAENSYRIGYQVSNELLGPSSSLTITLKSSWDSMTSTQNTEHFRKTQRFRLRNMATPISHLPVVANVRTNSDSRNQSNRNQEVKNHYRNRSIDSNAKIPMHATFYDSRDSTKNNFNFKLKKNSPQRFFSDEESSTVNDYTRAIVNHGKRINLNKHKETERVAATIVQSWWRGVWTRIQYKQIKIMANLKKAEIKAKKAMEKFENLKQQAERIPLKPLSKKHK